jgi:hypothetical protein
MTPKEKTMNKNDRVYWNDPDDGACSGLGTISSISGEIYKLKMDNGGEVEALRHELKSPAHKS